MKKLLIKLLAASLLFTAYSAHSQYQIDIQIEEVADSADLFLGYYFAGKTYVRDTATFNEERGYAFSGDDSLDKGMYFLAQNGSLLFDLVVGDDQFFTLKTNSQDYVDFMEVEGDEENSLFFDNMHFNRKRNEEATPLVEILRDSTSSSEAKADAQGKFEEINARVEDYVEMVLNDHPGSILAAILGANKRLGIPEEEAAKIDMNDKKARFAYFRDHYWDNIDLGNAALIRLSSPIYKQKVDDYMDNLVYPAPDSVKKAVDQLVKAARKDADTYQYLVWHLTIKYQTSKIMGLDEVYVHLVDNYFLTGEMDFWANDQLKKNLKEKADQYRSSLVGMVAPNLVLQDLNKQPKALHDLPNKYSVIYFYDPDCGHCKKETPVLKAFFDSTSFDVGVFTVSADTSMTKMGDYIQEMGLQDWTNTNGTKTYGLNYQEVYDAYTTPTIYVLNDKKEIIAKKLTASQIEGLLANYEGKDKKETN